jgi:hypothetical protein
VDLEWEPGNVAPCLARQSFTELDANDAEALLEERP